jgi:glyoxylase-like metal-dependent hydrolase (beta-lactamase superfamily II)
LDSCAGNHKNRPGFPRFHQLDIPFLYRLRAAGVQPGEVDVVLCTHLHSDHVGWNTMLVDGRWVTTFPNAKYLFSRTENEIGDPHRNPAAEADIQRGFAYCDSVLPVIEAGQAVLVDGEHAIDDNLTIVPAPGHTRGHVVLWLATTAGRALFSGDLMHHALQIHAPHWNSKFCELPDVARATRWQLIEQCVEHRATLFPAHFGAPHVTRIRALPHGFCPEFVGADRS